MDPLRTIVYCGYCGSWQIDFDRADVEQAVADIVEEEIAAHLNDCRLAQRAVEEWESIVRRMEARWN